MEDAVNAQPFGQLLPTGQDVSFSEIEATLARLVRNGRPRKRAPARALTATLIVVATPQRLVAAAEAVEQLGEASGVRAILISEGDRTSPIARVTETAIAIAGLSPKYLNNAVGALRLSSLPAAVWWRGGSLEALDDLANLADRLILDTEQPDEAWQRAAGLFDRTALTDLRWTALTRWRAALAHLFDMPHVRARAGSIRALHIEAADRPSARLFAGWLRSCLKWGPAVAIDLQPSSNASVPLQCVTLAGDGLSIALDLKESRTCLEAVVNGVMASARIVPLPEGTLAALIGEELGVRTRDLAFEKAVAAAKEIPA
jgi:hypothetical protein